MFDQILEQYRRYYWAANGLLILAIAWVIAGFAVREVVSRYVTPPPPRPQPVQQVRKAERPPSFADYQVILSRNLLNVKVEDAAPAPAAEDRALNDEPVKATIKAELLGTVAGPARYSFCIVRVNGQTEVVKVGELIGGQAEVLEIQRGTVTILNNGRREILTMDEEDAVASAPKRQHLRPEPVARSEAPPSSDIDVREVAPNTFEIAKDEFENLTKDLGPLLTQARVVPNFNSGKIDGYKIFAIKPESVYSKIGLQNGDVIQSINGVAIDSPEKALQLFQTLRTERNFTINLNRDSNPMSFTYNLR